jgi:hypothetical protein
MGGIVSAQTDNLITLSKQQIIGDAANEIGDKQFMDDLGKLKELRSFLIEQAVQLKPGEAAAMSFGKLNLLRWRIDGRMPTQEEWTALEGLTQDLFRHLSDPLRRRFLYSRLPWWIPRLVGALGLTAFAALMISIFLGKARVWIRQHSPVLPRVGCVSRRYWLCLFYRYECAIGAG